MEKEQLEKIVTGGILATFGAAITALTNTTDPGRIKVKNFIAGILAGTMVSFILRSTTWGDWIKELLIVIFSSFISTYWPLMEKIGKKLLLQKLTTLFGIQNKETKDVSNNDHI